MNNWKSLLAGGDTDAAIEAEKIAERWARYPRKLYFFLKSGYRPHVWQSLFHTATAEDRVVPYRHLVAGRRGGKTLSAAWEVLYYCLYPADYHWDHHQRQSSRALWVWALAKDYKLGRPALLTFIDVMHQAGLVKDVDYRYNRAEKTIEFIESGTLLEFKSADDPQSLRGAGLDILWIDEAAFIPNDEAWNVVRPSLSDKPGGLITTTTPDGTNWFYDFFFLPEHHGDARQSRVEYVSLDNPFFPRSEWQYAQATMHPIVFKREYLASFHAMAGVELHGDWLKYYVTGQATPFDHPDDVRLIPKEGKLPLRLVMAVDPAISLSDKADYFAMILLGIEKDNHMAYVLRTFKERIAFPEQVEKIAEWHAKYKPDAIGVESNAYQRALIQQLERLPNMVPVVPVFSKGKKSERILAMTPLFRTGRIRIHRQQRDFIDQWVTYDSTLKNPKDDLLDATEIALGVAGVLVPNMDYRPDRPEHEDAIGEMAWEQIQAAGHREAYDEHLGSEW